MRLETALIAGSQGIAVHGQAISVIGDNISNANTTAFKGSTVQFSDLLSDREQIGENGNIAPAGNGVQIQEVRTDFATGNFESTGRPLDVAIDGEGFFIVGDATDPRYTRAGNFSVNTSGVLVDANGNNVLGYPAGSTTLGSLSLNSVKVSGGATTAAAISGNLSSAAANGTVPTNPTTFSQLNSAAATSSTFTAYDSLGAAHSIAVYYFKTDTNKWTAQAYIDGGDVGSTKGTPVKVGADATLTFNTSGQIETANQTAATIQNVAPAYSNGAAAGAFSINLGGFTQYASQSAIASNSQDGVAAGSINGYEIDTGGKVEAVFDNGTRQTLGTIQLASFTNKDGLERQGSSTYKAPAEAGKVLTGNPHSAGFGQIREGVIEQSNVDLSGQFVTLVVLQRGYQANSQTINAANQLLRDTLGLVR